MKIAFEKKKQKSSFHFSFVFVIYLYSFDWTLKTLKKNDGFPLIFIINTITRYGIWTTTLRVKFIIIKNYFPQQILKLGRKLKKIIVYK